MIGKYRHLPMGKAKAVMTSLTTLKPLNGTVATYQWQWQGKPITITYKTLGAGKPVLLLPALSTVSTRDGMATLAAQLMPHYQVTALDWPGFGDSDRPRLGTAIV